MERKNYLKENLSNKEKAFLKQLVINKSNEYLRKNIKDLNVEIVSFSDDIAVNVSLNINDFFDGELEVDYGISDYEKIASTKELYCSIKALSKKEKTVLFLLHDKKMPVNKIAEKMNISRETVWRNKKRAENKIIKKLNGGN